MGNFKKKLRKAGKALGKFAKEMEAKKSESEKRRLESYGRKTKMLKAEASYLREKEKVNKLRKKAEPSFKINFGKV